MHLIYRCSTPTHHVTSQQGGCSLETQPRCLGPPSVHPVSTLWVFFLGVPVSFTCRSWFQNDPLSVWMSLSASPNLISREKIRQISGLCLIGSLHIFHTSPDMTTIVLLRAWENVITEFTTNTCNAVASATGTCTHWTVNSIHAPMHTMLYRLFNSKWDHNLQNEPHVMKLDSPSTGNWRDYWFYFLVLESTSFFLYAVCCWERWMHMLIWINNDAPRRN